MVAGLLAVGSIVLSAIAMGLGLILELDARPVPDRFVAIILALVSARLSARYQSLALKALLFAMVAWVVGMTLAVLTENPLCDLTVAESVPGRYNTSHEQSRPERPNAGYVAQMLEAYLDAPASVPTSGASCSSRIPMRSPLVARARRPAPSNGAQPNGTARVVAACTAPPPVHRSPVARTGRGAPRRRPRRGAGRLDRAEAQPATAEPAPVDETLLGGVAAAMALVKAYRMHGHLAARLDPLGSEPMGDPALDESRLVPSLTPELQARIPASLLRLYVDGDTLLEALPLLRAVYTGSIAYEIEHISDHAERVWLRQAIESGRFRQPLDRRGATRAAPPPLRRPRASSSTCAARSSGRSSSRSRASSRSCRCSTRRSRSRRPAGRTRS